MGRLRARALALAGLVPVVAATAVATESIGDRILRFDPDTHCDQGIRAPERDGAA
jgi:hypothetical protein